VSLDAKTCSEVKRRWRGLRQSDFSRDIQGRREAGTTMAFARTFRSGRGCHAFQRLPAPVAASGLGVHRLRALRDQNTTKITLGVIRVGYGQVDWYLLYWRSRGNMGGPPIHVTHDLGPESKEEMKRVLEDESIGVTEEPPRYWYGMQDSSRGDSRRLARAVAQTAVIFFSSKLVHPSTARVLASPTQHGVSSPQ
jgi:hypothetical protein